VKVFITVVLMAALVAVTVAFFVDMIGSWL
jgi:hypothetical protein